MSETDDNRQLRLRLEAETIKLGRELKGKMPPGAGFLLFLCDLGSRGSLAYTASVARDDARRLAVEWLGVTGGADEAVDAHLTEFTEAKDRAEKAEARLATVEGALGRLTGDEVVEAAARAMCRADAIATTEATLVAPVDDPDFWEPLNDEEIEEWRASARAALAAARAALGGTP